MIKISLNGKYSKVNLMIRLQKHHGRHRKPLVPETFLRNASFMTNWRHVILYICVRHSIWTIVYVK